jgi:hypothetical protein
MGGPKEEIEDQEHEGEQEHPVKVGIRERSLPEWWLLFLHRVLGLEFIF